MLAAAVLLPACSGETGGATSDADLVVDLCRAVGASDAEAAAEVFEAEVHAPLHTFIDQLSEADRAAAEQVLLAKFDVENALTGASLPPDTELATLLRQLLATTREGHEALGTTAPDC